MKVSSSFRSTYPKLASWIDSNLPKVVTKPKVWSAFKKYGELSQVKALLAVTPGELPEVHFDSMPGANGKFSGYRFPDRVFLAKSICDKFESVDSSDVRMHVLVESTLLHEMVHWGDWKDGKDQAGEEGKMFERAAYGRDVNRYW